MDYLTVKEAGEKWGIGPRTVALYCAENRIDGAVKRGNLWLVPAHAERPGDRRRRGQIPVKAALPRDLARLISLSAVPFPAHDPDAVLHAVKEDAARLVLETDLAYLRGDFSRVARCFARAEGDEATGLRVAPAAVAAAISTGDYAAYTAIDAYLEKFTKAPYGSGVIVMAEMAKATAAIGMVAPDMAPDWLKEGDFSAFAKELLPLALYLRSKYFLCLGCFEAMLATAETALAFTVPEGGITHPGIFLRVTCAVACYGLEEKEAARRWLLEAMAIALPHGFITPFAEAVTSLGGLMEQCLEEKYPASYGALLSQWKRTWKNWVAFHNQFTKDHITMMLSLREYHIAQMAVRHIPYARIAAEHGISVGRLKNIMLEIYGKLYISGRDELGDYIF